jgi:hypothetical protein
VRPHWRLARASLATYRERRSQRDANPPGLVDVAAAVDVECRACHVRRQV